MSKLPPAVLPHEIDKVRQNVPQSSVSTSYFQLRILSCPGSPVVGAYSPRGMEHLARSQHTTLLRHVHLDS